MGFNFHCSGLNFQVPDDVMMKSQFSYIEQGDPVPLDELGSNNIDPGVDDGYHAYIDNCFAGLVQVLNILRENIFFKICSSVFRFKKSVERVFFRRMFIHLLVPKMLECHLGPIS